MIKKIFLSLLTLSLLSCVSDGTSDSSNPDEPYSSGYVSQVTETSRQGYNSIDVAVDHSTEGYDMKALPVPAFAGEGQSWELQENVSDNFDYTFAATNNRTNFGDGKWYNFYHNSWDGPGSTYWKHDHVEVDGKSLVVRASRSSQTAKMGVLGIKSGCVTSNDTVMFPVFVEASISVADIALASDVWLLSPDDTQEIDIIECYGGAYNGNEHFSQFVHLSHHSFIRQPFTDYQPRDKNSWWPREGVSSWGEYCNPEGGDRQFLQVGVNWVGAKHFEYYIDGELVRVLYDKAFATKINGTWMYTYPEIRDNGELVFTSGYQYTTTTAKNEEDFSFDLLLEANAQSPASVIDPYNFQKGKGFTKPLDIIINVESQDWHVADGRTPDTEHLENPAMNNMRVDWIRIYKPVDSAE